MTSNPHLVDTRPGSLRGLRKLFVVLLVASSLLVSPRAAFASLLPPEMEDALAKWIAIFVIFFVPVILIVVFWLVHVMPEKIAHKRHHPQFEAIRTLCLLSLAFGGLLWPLAWLWAYTKPVGYKLAYGTDKHPDYFKEQGIPESDSALGNLGDRILALEGRGIPASELDAIRSDLAALEARLAATGDRNEVA